MIPPRTPNPRKMTETIYRVVGYERDASWHVRTWKFTRVSDAEYRARKLRRLGELVEFSVATVTWTPYNDGGAS